MKRKLKPLTISLCLLGAMSMPVFAASTSNDNAVDSRTQILEKQVAELQQEVAALRDMRTSTHHARKTVAKSAAVSAKVTTPVSRRGQSSSVDGGEKLITTAEMGQAEANKNVPTINGPQYLPESGVQYLPVDLDVPGQSFVSTGPYIGVPLQYSGGDLIINSPTVNEDVLLLTLRKNIDKRLMGLGLQPEDLHSHLLLSGVIEGQVVYKNVQGAANSSDIDLTNAGIDAYVLTPSTWVSGLISLNYDNNIGTQSGSFSNNLRTGNSRVFVNKAFIVIGDLSKSPFYGTLGQMYVPFGVYSSSLISSPLPKLIARAQERAILVGYQKQASNALYASVYGFKGDSYVGAVSRINNGGINLGYKFAQPNFSGRIGGGVLANIADSQGMQDTGNGALTSTFGAPATFGGFGGYAGTGNEQITHRVPAYDVNTLISIGKTVDLLAEYITASTTFNPNDMTMNSKGAQPKALDVEAAYTFQSLCKPTSVTLGYGMSKDALALGLPAKRYSLAFNTSIWRNTLQSLEFRHDGNYALSSTSTGAGVSGPVFSGHYDNAVTAQFDIYF